jgi:indolepyruvate ferredoxin oxidoreductase
VPSPDDNVEAFRWGRWLVVDPEALAQEEAGELDLWAPKATKAAERAVGDLPVRDLLVRRFAQVVDYQGLGLARRWLSLVEEAAAVDTDGSLTSAVAEGWFRVLTYKDEYEVARLHLRLPVERGAKVRYHLHPPTLRRLGARKKIAVPAGVARPAFRVLAAGRRVRGTPLDLFGLAKHRREERSLIDEYEAVVRRALTLPHDEAVHLAESIQAVRGYEDIKSAAIARWREAVSA